jgi:hypothetical protein
MLWLRALTCISKNMVIEYLKNDTPLLKCLRLFSSANPQNNERTGTCCGAERSLSYIPKSQMPDSSKNLRKSRGCLFLFPSSSSQTQHPKPYVAAPSPLCHTSPKLQPSNSRESNVSMFHGCVSSLLFRLNYKNVKDPFMFRLWPLFLLLSSQIENLRFLNYQKDNQDEYTPPPCSPVLSPKSPKNGVYVASARTPVSIDLKHETRNSRLSNTQKNRYVASCLPLLLLLLPLTPKRTNAFECCV